MERFIVLSVAGAFVVFRLSVAGAVSWTLMAGESMGVAVVIALAATVIITDTLDGYLIRRYVPSWALRFRRLDSLSDFVSLGSVFVVMYWTEVMPAPVAAIIALRQTIAGLLVAYFSRSGRMAARYRHLFWNRTYYLVCMVVVVGYLVGAHISVWIGTFILAIFGLATILNYLFPGRLGRNR